MRLFYPLLRNALCLLLCGAPFISSAVVVDTTRTDRHVSPGGLMDTVYDRNGNKYPLGTLAINDTVRRDFGGSPSQLIMASCNSGYFQLYLESGCGMEDSTNPADVARLAVVCQVLADLSALINNSSCNTGQKVNIWVRNIANIGAPAGVAGLATSFYIAPVGASVGGIADNMVWLTLHTGVDAYTHLSAPLTTSTGITFFHGMMAFNFSSLTWHTDLLTSPGSGEYDLYSTVLHEMMHALGFQSLIDYTGNSQFGTSYPYFSRYDLNLGSPAATPLITNGGDTCSLYDYSFNPSLSASSVLTPGCTTGPSNTVSNNTVCSTAVKYYGGQATPVPVYTPTCWEAGSSISHFEDECYAPATYVLQPPYSNDQYFLMSNATLPGPYNASTNPGCMKRYPEPEERQVLADIGYSVNTTFGNTSNLNSYNYGGSTTPGIAVGGVNDGIDSGTYMFIVAVGSSITLHGSDILNNDCGVNGGTFECLQNVIGGGTLSKTYGSATDSFTYSVPSGSTPGVYLLRYVPVSASGQKGNITYIFVLVTSGDCTPTACNMIPNGDFESASCGNISGQTITCWTTVSGTPDIYARGCSDPGHDIPTTIQDPFPVDVHPGADSPYNNHFAGLWSLSTPANFSDEAMQTTLSAYVNAGTKYTLTFWARQSSESYPGGTDAYLLVGISNGPLTQWPTFGTALPSVFTLLDHRYTVPGDSRWHLVTDTFTYAGSTGNNLVVVNANNYNAPTSGKYIDIDDMKLLPYIACQFALPDSIGSCDTIADLSVYVSNCGVVATDSFGGPGVIYDPSTSKYEFVPVLAGQGNKTIWYTYTDGNGCTNDVETTTDVVTGLTIVPSPGDTLCPGQTLTLSVAGSDNYSWTASTGTVSCTGTCSVAYANPTVNTTYTVTGQNSGCTGTIAIAVNGITDSTITAGGPTTFCTGGSVTLTAPTGSGYTYQWYNSSATVGSSTHVNTLVVTTSGVYTVTITNTTGCVATSQPVTVTVDTPITLSITLSTHCSNDSIVLSTTSGYGPYQWSENGTNIPSATSSTYTATSSGIYTVASTGCANTSAPDTIVIAGSPVCGPCTVFGGAPFTVYGPGTYTASSFVTGGRYYITGDILLTGTSAGSTITRAYILVAKGVTITVDSVAKITLDSCHIFGCDSLWNGFVLLTRRTPTTSVCLTLTHSTLIEDAAKAVYISTASYNYGFTTIVSRGAIFNKDIIGMEIDSFTATFANAGDSITNTIYTSRGLATAYNTWPGTAALKRINTSATAYNPPYALDTFAQEPCINGSIAYYGIVLNDVGYTQDTGSYTMVIIGSNTPGLAGLNIFDNLNDGIYASNSNLNVFNSSFMNMNMSSIYGGNGIYALATDTVAHVIGVLPNTDSASGNRFYNCQYSGVNVTNYYDITGMYSMMMSNQSLSHPASTCQYGYDIKTTGNYYHLQVDNNSIANIKNGIFLGTGASNAGAVQTSPTLSIRWNNVQVTPVSGASASYSSDKYVNIGINAQTTLYIPVHDTLNINHNTVTDAFNGIIMNGFLGTIDSQCVGAPANTQYGKLIAAGNTVTIRQFGTAPSTAQYGMSATGCSWANISDNNIAGTSSTNDSMRGMYIAGSVGTIDECNEVDSIGRGFEYVGNQTYTIWFPGNTMEGDGKGFVLNNGYITQQGFINQPIGNEWQGDWTNKFQTYTVGAVFPVTISQYCSSPLFVNSGTTTEPSVNGNSLFNASYTYAPFNGIAITGGTPVSCTPTPLRPRIHLYLAPIVLNQMEYGQLPTINEWIDQFHVWQCLDNCPAILTGAPILTDFYSAASAGPFAVLSDIERAFAANDLTTASSLISYGKGMTGSWSDYYYYYSDYYGVYLDNNDSNNYIPGNYFTYYQLYLNYLDGTLSADDSDNIAYLAGSCPLTNGNVVYEARGLYSLVFGPQVWTDDNCSDAVRKSRSANGANNDLPAPSIQDMVSSHQRYKLYPNPNDGHMSIQQVVMDDKPVQAELWNNEGKSMFNGRLLFSNGVTNLDIPGLMPGLYMLQLRDSYGNSFTLKFVVNYQ